VASQPDFRNGASSEAADPASGWLQSLRKGKRTVIWNHQTSLPKNGPASSLHNCRKRLASVDGVLVGRQHLLSASKCADQRQQCGTRQMKL